MSPVRIQRKRTKGWRMPEGAVYVGRGSRWGNPFKVVRDGGFMWVAPGGSRVVCSTDREGNMRERRTEAVELFALHIGPMGNHEYDTETLAALDLKLSGKDLACWCPLDQPCHADVLLELANNGSKP